MKINFSCLKKIFTSQKPSQVKLNATVASDVIDLSNISTKGLEHLSDDVVQVGAKTVEKSSKSKNPYMDMLYEMYEKDGVPKSMVDKILRQESPGTFYRFIGKDELAELLSGVNMKSHRPCHSGRVMDITTNPDYGKIPTIGKYRITFKDKLEFNPFNREIKTRVTDHDLKDAEYYLKGSYSLDDVAKIEKKTGNGEYELLPNWESVG